MTYEALIRCTVCGVPFRDHPEQSCGPAWEAQIGKTEARRRITEQLIEAGGAILLGDEPHVFERRVESAEEVERRYNLKPGTRKELA